MLPTISKIMSRALLAAVLSAASRTGAMTASELQAQLASGTKVTIVDIRAPSLYAKGHVPGAINVPASLCPAKTLPPIGRVVVYDSGLDVAGTTVAQNAASALGKSPGVSAEVLEGGYSGWESAHALTTRGKGAVRESFNYITYAQLKAARAAEVALVDLRRPKSAKPLTDLTQEFPDLPQVKSAPEKAVAAGEPMLVLIDSADGTAEQTARTLKASGSKRYVILVGGETTLERKGERGLQRDGAGSRAHPSQNVVPTGTAK
jgi:rhodanese-related sulfurtransferase